MSDLKTLHALIDELPSEAYAEIEDSIRNAIEFYTEKAAYLAKEPPPSRYANITIPIGEAVMRPPFTIDWEDV